MDEIMARSLRSLAGFYMGEYGDFVLERNIVTTTLLYIFKFYYNILCGIIHKIIILSWDHNNLLFVQYYLIHDFQCFDFSGGTGGWVFYQIIVTMKR